MAESQPLPRALLWTVTHKCLKDLVEIREHMLGKTGDLFKNSEKQEQELKSKRVKKTKSSSHMMSSYYSLTTLVDVTLQIVQNKLRKDMTLKKKTQTLQ